MMNVDGCKFEIFLRTQSHYKKKETNQTLSKETKKDGKIFQVGQHPKHVHRDSVSCIRTRVPISLIKTSTSPPAHEQVYIRSS